MSRRPRPALRVVLACLLPLALVTSLVACEQEDSPDPDPTGPVRLSFGVFGTDAEVGAYQEMVDAYNAQASATQVDLVAWSDGATMRSDFDRGVDQPDVFLTARRDLASVVENQRNTPLFDLLDARNISFGDDYASRAIEAFSADDDLQCMPYSVSPMVIYYNTDLIDFEAMRALGLPAPVDELEGWTFEEFRAAATYATSRRTRGVSLDATLRSLAPLIYSGGGQLFNDSTSPTSTDFSSDGNRETLTTALELLRDSSVTLSEEQLAEATPQEWFERGRLGMIEGFRDLTPTLRGVEGLDFDVMPMPELGGPATVGELTGLCIAPGEHVQQAADFLVHAISDEGVDPLARSGYIVPANLTVARSPAFLQPQLEPAHAGVFNASVDDMVLLPLIEDADGLAGAVAPLLDELLNAPVIDLAAVTTAIDEASRSVLDPDYVAPLPSESSS